MYRSNLNRKDKSGALMAVVAIHVALAFAFLNMSDKIDLTGPQRKLVVFDVRDLPPPPPPPPPPPKPSEQAKPKEKEGGSAPNIKSEATPVVAPKPQIALPVPPKIAVTETPREGATPTQGASTIRGPGTGTGGSGTGTGTGSGGGSGGGDGGIATRAQLLTPSLRSRDFPGEMRRLLSQGRAPLVMFTVLPSGRVANCRVYQPSGDPELDSITCALVTSRFVYRPAFNRRGEPVSSQMAYRQAF
jgi:protein TonB